MWGMTEQERAAEHLKVIRSLMERATIYRAISWPTALFGGVVAVILSVLLYFREEVAIGSADSDVTPMSEVAWVAVWLVALVVTGVFNAILVGRKAAREKTAFFSPGLKVALRHLVPPMLAGGVLGVFQVLSDDGTASERAAIWVRKTPPAKKSPEQRKSRRLDITCVAPGPESILQKWPDT